MNDETRISHIRVGVKRAGYRLNDRGSSGHTLCGAFITSDDMTWGDARRAMKYADWFPRLCSRCLEKAKLK